jgi:hypothetical protein
MVCNDIAGIFIFPENCWHGKHFLIMENESLKIDGQHNLDLIFLWEVEVGANFPHIFLNEILSLVPGLGFHQRISVVYHHNFS